MQTSRLLAFAFVAPAMLVLLLILGWPLLSAVILSFQDVRYVGTEPHWVGFENYVKMLSGSKLWSSIGLSLIWVVANAVLQTVMALAAALALNEQFRGAKIARTWIILTWIVPTVEERKAVRTICRKFWSKTNFLPKPKKSTPDQKMFWFW